MLPDDRALPKLSGASWFGSHSDHGKWQRWTKEDVAWELGEGAIHASQLCDSLWPSCLPIIPLLQSNGGRRLALCIAWVLGSSWYLGLVPLAKLAKDFSDFKVSLLLWKCCFTAVPNVRTKRWRLCQLVTEAFQGVFFCCFNVWRCSCDMWWVDAWDQKPSLSWDPNFQEQSMECCQFGSLHLCSHFGWRPSWAVGPVTLISFDDRWAWNGL